MEFTLDQAALDIVFNLPRNDGSFSQSQRIYLQALSSRRPNVFLAFAPKAAGTFLRIAVVKAVAGDVVRIVHAQGGRDAQPYLPTFVSYYRGGICAGPLVAHAHMQALPANRSFFEALSIRPVVMIRSIPDMLASYWDMLETDEAARRDGLNCIIPPNFPDLSRTVKADFLVDILGPWYASYFASWFDYAGQAADRVHIIRYPQFLEAPSATLGGILSHSRLPRTPEQCEAAIDAAWKEKADLRFNRGEQGRGARYFDAEHIGRLAKQLSLYPSMEHWRAELLAR